MKFLNSGKKEADRRIKKYLPRKHDKRSLEWLLGKARYAYDIKSCNMSVNRPIWDLLDRGGKRWRPALMMIVAEALGGKAKARRVADFMILPEIIHNGTLMIDDIEDSSDLRRGKACIHHIYGIDIAINAGNAMYFVPLILLMKKKKLIGEKAALKAYEIYTQEMINVSYGQGMDIYWHQGKVRKISEEQYLQMCAYKTGTLARGSAKFGAALVGAKESEIEAAGKFAEAIGVAFQIQDDILNLAGEEKKYGKEIGGDISEGKRTLIVLHSMRVGKRVDSKRLRWILDQHTKSQPLILEAIEMVNKTDSINYSKQVARKMVKKAWAEFKPMLKKSEAKEMLQAFATYLVERDV